MAKSSQQNMIPHWMMHRMQQAGMKLTQARLTILTELITAGRLHQHDITPEVLYERIAKKNRPIALATIYRALKLLVKKQIVIKHDFHEGRSRYEINDKSHHDHLIDIDSGRVIEFYDKELEDLQKKIIDKLGYDIIDHRLEIYGRKK